MEAAYLAGEAGFETVVIDRDPLAPARALADDFYNLDVLKSQSKARKILKEFDLILPATENYPVLAWLNQTGYRINVPVALDLTAYNISSSKLKSNELFAGIGVPVPKPWPECGFPVIVKPSGLSGSTGVEKVDDRVRLAEILGSQGSDLVIQQYLQGPSYSLEVIADRGSCAGLQITELGFDAGYDCKRVLAGPDAGSVVADAFYSMGEQLVAALNLSGIMDIEVIDTGSELKLLEVDARIPSQTPSAVYHSSGINMVGLLADYWINGKLPPYRRFSGEMNAIIYEHLRFKRGVMEVSGEHVLVGAQGLKVYRDRLSAQVLISNFEQSPEDWVATVITGGKTGALAWQARERVIKELMNTFGVKRYLDPCPLSEGGDGYDQAVL